MEDEQDPSPIPFSPFSSSSRRRKLRGTGCWDGGQEWKREEEGKVSGFVSLSLVAAYDDEDVQEEEGERMDVEIHRIAIRLNPTSTVHPGPLSSARITVITSIQIICITIAAAETAQRSEQRVVATKTNRTRNNNNNNNLQETRTAIITNITKHVRREHVDRVRGYRHSHLTRLLSHSHYSLIPGVAILPSRLHLYQRHTDKTTDENLTSENWELILNLCDKVQDEGQTGAHSAIAAILKRLTHRNPNVQLYALSLTEALGKNLGIEIHRELASRAFTQGIERLIIDRNTHEKVRRRALGLVAAWTAEFENDTSLGIMEDCYNSLKAKNYKFELPSEPPPPTVDDEIRRKEEEELQRVLEMSMQDRGGWSAYSLAGGSSSSSSGAAAAGGASSSSAGAGAGAASSRAGGAAAGAGGASSAFAQPKYQAGGYVPARTPSPSVVAAQQRRQQVEYEQAQAAAAAQQRNNTPAYTASSSTPAASTSTTAPAASTTTTTTTTTSTSSTMAPGAIVTRVRALHTFEPTEPGELAFEAGDIIKVVDRGYKDWWRGQLKGRTGIFPVNYVEPLPEPTPEELAAEAQQEAAVFAQAVNIERLLNMLRGMDPQKESLADNEEVQELYRQSMALRPKIVKLIDRYSQKRADLVSMNETFVRARTIFDRMMEESLARHTGVYDQQPPYRPGPIQTPYGPPPQQQRYGPGPGPVGYGTPVQTPGVYGMPPPDAARVASPYQPQPQPQVQVQVPPYAVDPAAYGVPQQQQQQQQVQAGYGVVPQGGYAGQQPGVPYSQQGPVPYPVAAGPGPGVGTPGVGQGQQPQAQQQQQGYQQQQPQQQQQAYQQQPGAAASPQPQSVVPQAYVQAQQQQPVQHVQQQAQSPPPQQQHQQAQVQPVSQQPQAQAQPQTLAHTQPQQQQQQQQQTQPATQPATQPQPQPQAQPTQQPTQPISGPPPYAYDPSYTYADPNVQAWAQYYAQGGLDKTGAVYFVEVPGVTGPSVSVSAAGVSTNAGAGAGAGEGAVVGAQREGQGQGQLERQGSYTAQQQQEQQQVQQPQEVQPQPQPQPQALPQVQGGVHNGPRYQLTDQPASPQAQQQQQFASASAPVASSPSVYAYEGVPVQGQAQAPVSPGGSGQPAPVQSQSQSPVQSGSTPAWVLPKKTPVQPGPGQGQGEDAFAGLVGGMRGLSTGE
ncbi:hypothetical protein D9613_006509 [Agrocybe pediades]|uniref:Class E vacuolar protein-sorting machinery protein HSE1 n=1 Tax=Agrocybe pediades TaxID=84607 RepID=A0A8H4QHQ2_9AGAR|nr:hypothetical protein D9613_006509 [Agrocybe pediades]